jgi:hypothetical protein
MHSNSGSEPMHFTRVAGRLRDRSRCWRTCRTLVVFAAFLGSGSALAEPGTSSAALMVSVRVVRRDAPSGQEKVAGSDRNDPDPGARRPGAPLPPVGRLRLEAGGVVTGTDLCRLVARPPHGPAGSRPGTRSPDAESW